jgi:uncharacterized repeat protein (TIGR03803 family)
MLYIGEEGGRSGEIMRCLPAMRIAIGFASLVGLALPALAATESVLYSFPNSGTGYPLGSLYFRNGSLYGTAAGDPRSGSGQVFKLTNKGASWKESTVLTFDGTDGSLPWAGLVSDSHGVFYGTASGGGTYNGGTAFALYKSGGKWVEQTIWDFGGSGDGADPQCTLVIDQSGNFFGMTSYGGTYNLGTVFELSDANGVWTEKVLYSFRGNGDGWFPYAGLLLAGRGMLFGTTQFGGSTGDGTVFSLSKSQGVWKEDILYSFTGGVDGGEPLDTPIMDKNGALYGTTYAGGAGKDFADVGVVFKLTPSGRSWSETVLYNFGSFADDGENPFAGLTFGPNGSLYGTTAEGGCPGHPGVGTVFELTPSTTNANWTETILHCFAGGSDGSDPQSGVTLDESGTLYGTTMAGGTDNLGAVWSITP